MDHEVKLIIRNLKEVTSGEPWFGRPVFTILEEVDTKHVYQKPNGSSHSLIELLYHMNIWADFILKRLEKDPDMDPIAFEKLDWRVIDPAVHRWDKGLNEFKLLHKKIIDLLETKDDDFLNEPVDFRKYNFRHLLNGLAQHDLYHLGQVAYVQKLLA
jgi:uncharacterized damage-inducible protein DinB